MCGCARGWCGRGCWAGWRRRLCAAYLGLLNQSTLSSADVGRQMIVAAFTGLMTAVAAIGLLPVCENLFKITTDITLLELTDFNHPLLRKLQMSAPGSYHHSLMVANLAERAAAEAGANPLLCRACSLYHDIGKIVKPEYFNENQRDNFNPHEEVQPSMSALIIKSHVSEGLSLAKQHKLPRVVQDVIVQHHGTTLIKFFYHKASKQQRLLTQSPFGRQRSAEARAQAARRRRARGTRRGRILLPLRRPQAQFQGIGHHRAGRLRRGRLAFAAQSHAAVGRGTD